jgi:hypothetical protein
MTNSNSVPGAAAGAPPKIVLRSPVDLVAVTPYLLGFHPDHSVVLVALHGRRIAFVARGDLSAGPPATIADDLLTAARRQHPTEVAVLGYGPDEQVRPVVEACRSAARRHGLPVKEALRVDQGRWWSYTCDDDRCCPPAGTPYDQSASPVATRCVVEGLPALPSRQELVRQVAPLGGPTRTSMIQATERAWQRLSTRLEALPEEGCAAAVVADGKAAVHGAIERYAGGGRLDDDEVAWLSVLLQSITVRDVAWSAITDEQPHLRLWQDVTRRAEPELVPAPGSLLGFAAYRAGNGALARVALERVLGEDPAYSMARLLLGALRDGLPPSTFHGWPWPDADPGDPGDPGDPADPADPADPGAEAAVAAPAGGDRA